MTGGFFWVFMSLYSVIVVNTLKAVLKSDTLTSGTKNARNILMIGNGTLFGLLTAFWLLAYIHKQLMQNLYKHAVTWGNPIAWALLLSSLVEFIRGGKQIIGGSNRTLFSVKQRHVKSPSTG